MIFMPFQGNTTPTRLSRLFTLLLLGMLHVPYQPARLIGHYPEPLSRVLIRLYMQPVPQPSPHAMPSQRVALHAREYPPPPSIHSSSFPSNSWLGRTSGYITHLMNCAQSDSSPILLAKRSRPRHFFFFSITRCFAMLCVDSRRLRSAIQQSDF